MESRGRVSDSRDGSEEDSQEDGPLQQHCGGLSTESIVAVYLSRTVERSQMSPQEAVCIDGCERGQF